MIDGAAVTIVITLLYVSLATRFLSRKRYTSRFASVNHIVCHCTYYHIVTVIEGPEAVIDGKWVSATM